MLAFLLACAVAPEPAPEAAPPAPSPATVAVVAPEPAGPSLYDLDVPLEDQAGRKIAFDVDRGHPTLVAMFYASCPQACPLLIARMQGVLEKLPPGNDAHVLLLSLDPDHDTPQVLSDAAARHGLDTTHWTLARSAPDDVRVIAAALGVKYRATGSGEIQHTSGVTLVDAEGRVLASDASDETLIARLSGAGS